MHNSTTQNHQIPFSIPIKICDGMFLADTVIAQVSLYFDIGY